MKDTLLCADKEDAKDAVDAIGMENIEDWDFLDDGAVRLILKCALTEIKEKKDE